MVYRVSSLEVFSTKFVSQLNKKILSILFPFNSYFLVNDLLWGLNFVSDKTIILQGLSSEFKNVKLEFKDSTLKIWNSP